jgi:SAM-dependent methyltransferase
VIGLSIRNYAPTLGARVMLICLFKSIGLYFFMTGYSESVFNSRITMGDYTNMSGYYDLIMTSGYYDYKKIVNELIQNPEFHNVLEIGCGTGLILEELARRKSGIEITGIDLTAAMLSIAEQRLHHFNNIQLKRENVIELDLHQQYDLAFSYGGVWYFVMDGVNEPFLVSHIYDEQANKDGLARVAQHVQANGHLLLGVQGPHRDYQSPITNGYVYSQTIKPIVHGFTKHYFLHDNDEKLMEQSIDYRTYTFDEALALLGFYGFTYQPSDTDTPQFLRFLKS